ncbi:MAG TPA: hypothetical protein VLR94_09630 [Acidobacteriota bacterium]|nr:hypothetical protein [Acidobacteriota bacterium]
MKDFKIPSHQVDVVEIMRKIRQSAANSRSEMTLEEKVRREAKSEFLSLIQAAQVPDFMLEQIRQQQILEPYDPRTLYASSRAGVGGLIGIIRRILKPITKLFINLDPMAHELNRLTILNNFYLKTMQDLIAKVSALRVEIHMMKRRTGHQHTRDSGHQRHPAGPGPRRTRHGGRRENDNRNDNRNANRNQSRPAAEEPQA